MNQFGTAKSLVLAASIAVLAGCSSTKMDDMSGDADMTGSTATSNNTSAGTTAAIEQMKMKAEQLQAAQDAAFAADTLFFFDYDQSSIKADARTALQSHAAYLAANSSASVRLEGHADERGTRAYNVSLGERRANAVKRYLIVQGAASAQIETVSYGEERPLSLSQDESGYARNRRVELIYN
ncbi:peptidoglycan-associated lipoprotein Pal [Litorivicinus lipolyticus]|uniref:Peptidoglycan-associated protein n=1 Tax=Litorivicinus lipolyticus TaxID=418701 RepID=A0A5Q2Q9X0_9GAMM|nr:peptidoglycan-associated lipoprotein Pal [Litorivicinus lipolyticus]QGG80003.1 peptidoglycan-associated lipoprotein Pal [Litorivicinus lipolyticus]